MAQRFHFVALCLTTSFLVAGCSGPKEPEKPVQVTVVVIDSWESEGNKPAMVSGGMYQQFYEVEMEISEPPELAGQKIYLHAETRVGSSAQITSIGGRLKFFIEPKFIGREESEEPCLLDDLIGYEYLEDD